MIRLCHYDDKSPPECAKGPGVMIIRLRLLIVIVRGHEKNSLVLVPVCWVMGGLMLYADAGL
jgi:hypothetical protein